MAFRTWAKILLAALGVGALAGAGQLGVAYGLGLIRLTRTFDVTVRDEWTAHLAWISWFPMVAAVVGALAAGRLVPHRRPHPATAAGTPGAPKTSTAAATSTDTGTGTGAGASADFRASASADIGPHPRAGTSADIGAATGPAAWAAGEGYIADPVPGRRLGAGAALAVAVASALGAAVVIPLTMQPARTAQVVGVDPVLAVAVCAGIGALVGAFAGYAALAHWVARRSFGTLIIAIWVIAIGSVVPSLWLGSPDQWPAVRLGVLDGDFLTIAIRQRAAMVTMPALALVAGAWLGWAAVRRGRPLLTIALAGLPGPAMLTLAYLIAGPGSGTGRHQLVPYWAAVVTTGAGVLGSVLAALSRRGEKRPAPPAPLEDEAPTPAAATQRPALPHQSTGPLDPAYDAAAPRTPNPDPAKPDRLQINDVGPSDQPETPPSLIPSRSTPPPPVP